MSTAKTTIDIQKPQAARSLLGSYITGFVLSLLLTVAAYTTLTNKSLGSLTVAIVTGLAVVQLLVQLLFFMHLGRGKGTRLNLVIFGFMIAVIGIVAGGSLWIMHNLNYNMTAEDMNEYMLQSVNNGGI